MTVTATGIVVLGSGSLARALCLGLATVAPQDLEVTVLARDEAAAEELAYLGNVRAALAAAPVRFTARGASLTDPDELDRAVATAVLVVQCASWYSPWSASPRWKALVARAGFGVTLPLQARLALETAAAIQRCAARALFVNACYPDAVNPLLTRLGLPVLCGIGNIGTLAAGLRAQLGPAGELKLLAHHAHLHAPAHAEEEALAWLDGVEVAEVGKLLTPHRRVDRRRLNHITGFAAAQLLGCLLAGTQAPAHVPGPLGLPGGYPVRLDAGGLTIDLPSGLDQAAATAWNERATAREGIVFDGDRVRFTGAAAGVLAEFGLADGFAVEDTVAVAKRLAMN
jgi:hypothetical protein